MTDKTPSRYLIHNDALSVAAARDYLHLTVKQKPYVLVSLACLENETVLFVGNYLKICRIVLDERIYRRLCQDHHTHSFTHILRYVYISLY